MSPLHPASQREPITLPVPHVRFAADQRDCPTLKPWHLLASSGQSRVQFKGSKSPQYLYLHGLLYQRTISRGQECLRLCVPQCHRANIISSAHHDPKHGHQGPAETLDRLKKFYVWPYLHAEVSRYARACLLCQTLAPQSPPRPLRSLPRKQSPSKRHPPSYHQSHSHGSKPWCSPPPWNRWVPPPQLGPHSSANRAHPAYHAPGRHSHPHLLPSPIRTPPAHLQAPPHTRRRI